MNALVQAREALRRGELTRRLGVVRRLHGLSIEADGPRSHVGELCAIVPPGHDAWEAPAPGSGSALSPFDGVAVPPGAVLAEVVAIQPGRVTLMPYGSTQGLSLGSTVVALGDRSHVAVGDVLKGRVIDAFGHPLDGRAAPEVLETRPLKGSPVNPMRRPRIGTVLETGIRTIDALLTLGQGQRVGIFAGSGVGKSTLLGMIARRPRRCERDRAHRRTRARGPRVHREAARAGRPGALGGGRRHGRPAGTGADPGRPRGARHRRVVPGSRTAGPAHDGLHHPFRHGPA